MDSKTAKGRRPKAGEPAMVYSGTNGPTNGAAGLKEFETEYIATVKITGTKNLLLHGWNIEAIEEKSKAKKNSAKKKTDDLETYIYRDKSGFIVMPCANFCASIRAAGKKFQDPTSARKSMHDLLKAIVQPHQEFARINDGVKDWEFVDRRRVTVQRAGITRSRPAFWEGWSMEFQIMILEPEYLQPDLLHRIISRAGLLEGIGDHRPTYGTYRIDSFETKEIEF